MLRLNYVFLLSITSAVAQGEDAYLSKNNVVFSKEVLLDEVFQFMDTDLQENRIFIIGEDHTGKRNGEIHSLLLRYLALKKAPIHVFFEVPFSIEFAIRKYIYEGDTLQYQYLNRIFQYKPEEEMYFLGEIRSLVKEGYDIKVNAVDIENNYNLTIKRLIQLLPAEVPPAQIEKTIERIKKIEFSDTVQTMTWNHYDDFKLLAEDLEKSLEAFPQIYKMYFKDDYNELLEISRRFSLGLQCYTSRVGSKRANIREIEMYKNIVKVINDNPKDIFYGGFGIFHTPLKAYRIGFFKKKEPLAAMLNTSLDSPVNGKVCAIAIDYSHRKDYKYVYMNAADYPLFIKYSTNPLTLFKLNAKGTPFPKMSQKFQYVIINKY